MSGQSHDRRSRAGAWLALGLLLGVLPLRGHAQTTQPSPLDDVGQAIKLIDGGKLDQAITLLQPLAQAQPEPAGVEAALGKAYYQKRDYQNAVTHLEIALKQNPCDAESTQLLGLSYYLLSQVHGVRCSSEEYEKSADATAQPCDPIQLFESHGIEFASET